MDTDADRVFGALFIAAFSIIGCGVTCWAVRECRNKPTMKKSGSTQQLNSMGQEADPEVVIT